MGQAREWAATLPGWMVPAAGGTLAALTVASVFLVVRSVRVGQETRRFQTRMLTESEVSRLEERRREVEELLRSDLDEWPRLLGQVIADGVGRPVQISRVIPPRVAGKPAPYLTVSDDQGTRHVLTTDVKALQEVGLIPKGRIRPVAIGSAPESGLVWQALAERQIRGTGDVIPAIPRNAEWFLVLLEGR